MKAGGGKLKTCFFFYFTVLYDIWGKVWKIGITTSFTEEYPHLRTTALKRYRERCKFFFKDFIFYPEFSHYT